MVSRIDKWTGKSGFVICNCLSPLLFVVCLLPLTNILRNAAPRYHFASNSQKVNQLLFMDDLSYMQVMKSHLNH